MGWALEIYLEHHSIFWIFVAAVAAPLLAEIRLGFKLPVVVIEVLLGILIGPQVLHLIEFNSFLTTMYAFAMATTLFMAGMELDFAQIRGRPLTLAAGGWIVSVLLGLTAVGILGIIPQVDAPLMVTIALCTTGLGVLIPVFRDGGLLDSPFGRLIMAAGTVGEIGPIVAMSLLLSQRYSTWQEVGFLLAFAAIVAGAILVGMGARPPRLIAFLGRHMHASTQLPIRISLLILAGLFFVAQKFGFEGIFGAFAAGMVVAQVTKGETGRPLRVKIEAVTFGWFYPFFFVGTGIKFDVAALGQNLTTMLLVPTFLLLFLLVRGAPVFLYGRNIDRGLRWPFALSSSIPSLSIIVVITEIGTRTKVIGPEVAAAMIGAALLAVLLFPTIAGVMLAGLNRQRGAVPGVASRE